MAWAFIGPRDEMPAPSKEHLGPADRANLVGDSGPSGPENWIGRFGTGSDHVLVTLHAISPDAMATYSGRLSALFAESDAFEEIWHADVGPASELGL